MIKFKGILIWLCKKFTRNELLELIDHLIKILNDKNSEIKPKDDFKEKHPNYRLFKVDPLAPLNGAQFSKEEPSLDYKNLLSQYKKEHHKPLKPIHNRNQKNRVPEAVRCPHCHAPHQFIYYNDGIKRSQLKCKVCSHTFQLKPRFKHPPKYRCPYCNSPLFLWKSRPEVSIYKCGNKNCPHRIRELNKLNPDEIKLRRSRSSQFKINYQFRDYHFQPHQLKIASPLKPKVDLNRIHNDLNIFALVLTLHISYAITARKTAHMLRHIWGIHLSYQTVLNYVQTAAYYCHQFNLNHKGPIDSFLAGDETYIKVKKIWHYVWLFISSKSHKIAAYHFSNSRGAKDAITTMLEAVSTADENQPITMITDGNPSYQAGLHFINAQIKTLSLTLKKVIGLKNLDPESEEFRPFKQMIERLNRTYKYHVHSQNGFGSASGAVAKLVLFVTHYNFLRPHQSLNYRTPIHIPELKSIPSIQGKWAKIISMAA